MTIDISQSADQVHIDAKADLQKALPDEASRIAVSDKFSHSLQNDPEIKKQSYEDVKRLAESIRNIRAGFLDVATELVGFDAAEFKDTKGQVIKLGPKWRPYIKQFDDTLQFSLEQATSAVTTMKSINNVLGDVTEDDAADLKIEFEQFMKQLEKKEKESAEVKEKFTELADNVGLFLAEIDDALGLGAAKAAIQRAKDELKNLHAKLNELNKKIRALGIATINAAVGGAAAAVGAILTLNPVALLIAISAMLAAVGTSVALKKTAEQRSDCLQDIKKKEREIQVLSQRLEQVNQYAKQCTQQLETTHATLTDISPKMAVIANIWHTMNLDLQALNEDMNAHVRPDNKLSKFFLKKLNITKHIYRHLTLLLETYVEEVRAANVSTGGY